MRVEITQTAPVSGTRQLPALRRNGMTVRAFDAGSSSRLTRDWNAPITTIDGDIMSALSVVRQRARDLAQNNDYAKRYMRLMSTNVVGAYGFKLRVRAVEENSDILDKFANELIRKAWIAWGRKDRCSIDQRQSFRGLQHLALQSLVRDGEIFARVHIDKKSRYGMRLQLIEPERIDETYCRPLADGAYIKMGVECDANRRPIAYYLRKPDPRAEAYGIISYTREYERVPAQEIIHVFDQEFINQTRGISWLAQSMLSLRMLGSYDYAAVVAARAGASQMGFIETTEETAGQPTGDEEDSEGNELLTFSPNTFAKLNPGEKFVSHNPDYPHSQYEPFTKAQIRRLSAGLGVGYTSLSNDLSDTSYSSARVGLLEEREFYMLTQEMFIENFLEPIYSEWLNFALLAGGIRLPVYKFEKFNQPWFTGRRWGWVDPLKEVEAWILMVQAGFKSARTIIAENGDDIEQIYQELAEDRALAQKHDLKLKIDMLASLIKAAKPGNGTQQDEERHATELLTAVRGLLEEAARADATTQPTTGLTHA